MVEVQRRNNPDELNDLPCLYVREWSCPVQARDIPLEVCQLCIQARRLNMELNRTRLQTDSSVPNLRVRSRPLLQSLTRARGELEEIRRDMKEIRQESIERLQTMSNSYRRLHQLVDELERQRGLGPSTPIPFERTPTHEYEGGGVPQGELEELKRSLRNVREELIERLQTISNDYKKLYPLVEKLERQRRIEESTPTSLEPRFEEWDSPAALIHLIWDPDSGPSIEARYPEDWSWRERITKEMFSALYAITLMSGRQAEGMCLKFKNSKVVSIIRRGDNLLLLVLDPDQDFKDYNEEIRRMAEEAEALRDWEGVLLYLFRKYLSRLKASTRGESP